MRPSDRDHHVFEHRRGSDDEAAAEDIVWQYADGLADYMADALEGIQTVITPAFKGGETEADQTVDWALTWIAPDQPGIDGVAESYVNLIPTSGGGTHVERHPRLIKCATLFTRGENPSHLLRLNINTSPTFSACFGSSAVDMSSA